MKNAEEILEKINHIPPLSQSCTQILKIMGDPDYSISDVIRIAECDAGLTAKILKVSNSSSFALKYPITSLKKAITQMGGKMIAGIALKSCTGKLYDKKLDGYNSQNGQLWEHSLKTAIASRELAKFSKKEIASDAVYTAGILHDIGKSILSQFIEGSEEIMIKKIEAGEFSNFLEAERSETGIDHCYAGERLASHWKLPLSLQDVISNHHFPSMANSDYRHMAYVVHLGDMVSMIEGTGTDVDFMKYPLDKDYDKYIDISQEKLEKIIIDVELEFEKIKTSILEK